MIRTSLSLTIVLAVTPALAQAQGGHHKHYESYKPAKDKSDVLRFTSWSGRLNREADGRMAMAKIVREDDKRFHCLIFKPGGELELDCSNVAWDGKPRQFEDHRPGRSTGTVTFSRSGAETVGQ